MKNFHNHIGNQTRDLSTCGTVPKTTVPRVCSTILRVSVIPRRICQNNHRDSVPLLQDVGSVANSITKPKRFKSYSGIMQIHRRHFRCNKCSQINSIYEFSGLFEKLRIAYISFFVFVCLSVRPSALKNLASSGRIFVKFDM